MNPPILLGELITLSNGKKLILLNKYTYLNQGAHPERGFKWACSCSKDCDGHLVVSENLEILSLVETHDHLPPKYKKTGQGYYINLDWFKKTS